MIYAHAYGYLNMALVAARDFADKHLKDVESVSRPGILPIIVKMKNGDEHHFIRYAEVEKWSRGRHDYVYNGDHCRNGYIVVMPRKIGDTAALKAASEFSKEWRARNENKRSH